MTDAPKVFISYAWTSNDHIAWVLQLATDLRAMGVDVILDKWDLKEGHDANAFMERMITDPDVSKVVMVCDEAYARKADARSGGVGTEAQIISPSLYAKKDQNKFVAVIRDKNDEGQPFVPVFYGARIHIDMSDGDLYGANVEQLLRWIFDKPSQPKPPVGKRPSFLTSNEAARVGNNSLGRQAADALKRFSPNALMLAEDYLDTVLDDLEDLRITPGGPLDKLDEEVVRSVEQFLPTKNDLIELFSLVARTQDNDAGRDVLTRFFERLSKLQKRPDSVINHNEGDWDNFKFIGSELFLSLIAVLIKKEKFAFMAAMLDAQYFEPGMHGVAGAARGFTTFSREMRSLYDRNARLNLGRYSLKADMLRARVSGSGIDFSELMQADFLLYLRSCVNETVRQNTFISWRPLTLTFLGYGAGPFEIFGRATSASYFERLKAVLNVDSVAELRALFAAFRAGSKRAPELGGETLPVLELANAERLATTR